MEISEKQFGDKVKEWVSEYFRSSLYTKINLCTMHHTTVSPNEYAGVLKSFTLTFGAFTVLWKSYTVHSPTTLLYGHLTPQATWQCCLAFKTVVAKSQMWKRIRTKEKRQDRVICFWEIKMQLNKDKLFWTQIVLWKESMDLFFSPPLRANVPPLFSRSVVRCLV